MTSQSPRDWVPAACEMRIRTIAETSARAAPAAIAARIEALVQANAAIHETECFNLNPAANVINPAAEALLARGLGSRPSLGYPGAKYEMGLEAVEEIEVIATTLAARTFHARHAELRPGSGAMANLWAFMALAKPGDSIIVPPASIGGHVTHHGAGCAGLYGLTIHEAPVNAAGYTVDPDGLRDLARRVRPKIITIGGSLNLFPHPVADLRAVADEVGAHLLFDAAHLAGVIAGGNWPNPLAEGAHLMTMSTYKSLGGPAGGLLVTDDNAIAQRLDAIAFPGMTANFDMGRVAALAIALLDWSDHGAAYARAMVENAQALAGAMTSAGLPVFAADRGATQSHGFAMAAASFGGGQAAARHLRRAGFLTSGIGLPLVAVMGDMNGLRLGSPEMTRWGMTPSDMTHLGALIAEALHRQDPEAMAPEVAAMRRRFDRLAFVRTQSGAPV